jgi:hypothetical protein
VSTIGRRPLDVTIIALRDLYEPPFLFRDIPEIDNTTTLIPATDLIVQGYMVEVMRLRNPGDVSRSKIMIHKDDS